LESRYPGGSFDAHYSENRKAGDLWVNSSTMLTVATQLN
jgi:hypothetical protein